MIYGLPSPIITPSFHQINKQVIYKGKIRIRRCTYIIGIHCHGDTDASLSVKGVSSTGTILFSMVFTTRKPDIKKNVSTANLAEKNICDGH